MTVMAASASAQSAETCYKYPDGSVYCYEPNDVDYRLGQQGYSGIADGAFDNLASKIEQTTPTEAEIEAAQAELDAANEAAATLTDAQAAVEATLTADNLAAFASVETAEADLASSQEAEAAASTSLADAQTVAQAFAAGPGSRIKVSLGNKVPQGLPVPQPPPLDCEVTVRTLGDGRFRISGPIYTGETWNMGRTAVLAHEAFTAVVSERPMEPLDLAVFESVGVDPRAFDFLLLKPSVQSV